MEYTKEELSEILYKHKKWLNGKTGGEQADLQDANLRYADLRGADLQYAKLQNADLRYANLQYAKLLFAKLRYADLRYADLRYADLRYADLRDADLQDADLRYADLQNADLRYADLQNADLDYSCFPLWFGSLGVHIDDRQAVQLLYHLVRNVQFSKNISEDIKKLLITEEIVKKANEFRRVEECGVIKTEVKQ